MNKDFSFWQKRAFYRQKQIHGPWFRRKSNSVKKTERTITIEKS